MNSINIKLPVTSTGAVTNNPRKIFLFAHTKCGKTTLASKLKNNLIIDLENGSDFIDGMKINVVKEAKASGVSVLDYLKALADQLRSSEHRYDYITMDTATALEDLATQLATILYRASPTGKNFTGTNVITELPNGAGYAWLRMAFEKIYGLFDGLAKECLIILGHVKSASINKDGKDLEVRDLNLTGKMKLIVSADVDAIGFLYRSSKDPNELIVSFKTSELDLATGSRAEHLRQEEFPILTYDPATKTFKDSWNKIFIK